MMFQIKSVFNKEWKDSWRDRRGLLAILAFALLTPTMMAGVLWMVANKVKDADLPMVSIVGAEYAPDIVTHLENRGFTVRLDKEVTLKDNLPTTTQGAQALVVLDQDFADNYRDRMPAKIYVYADMGKDVQRIAVGRLEYALRVYGQGVSESRLVEHGVSPMITIPFVVDKFDLSAAGAKAKGMASMFLMLFLMAPFYGSMSIALDTMAGERERDSLQPLLAQPVHTLALATGKWLVAAFFGLLCTLVVTVCCSLVLASSPLASLGIRLVLDPFVVTGILLSLIPLGLMVAALQLYISLRAKSFKEGQMYLGMLVLVPMMLLAFTSFADDGVKGWLIHLPIFTDQNTISELLATGTFDFAVSAPGMVFNLVVAGIMVALTARHLGSEALLDEG